MALLITFALPVNNDQIRISNRVIRGICLFCFFRYKGGGKWLFHGQQSRHIRSYAESWPEATRSVSISARRLSRVKWTLSGSEVATPFSSEGALSLLASVFSSGPESFLCNDGFGWECAGALPRGTTTPGKSWSCFLNGLKNMVPVRLLLWTDGLVRSGKLLDSGGL